MPRRDSVNLIRDIGVDPLYGSAVVQKLINLIMWRGKKNVARLIAYDALGVVAKKAGGGPEKTLKMFYKAIEQVTPAVEVKSRRVGGGVYQVPTEVSERRAQSLALRWLVQAASKRGAKTMGRGLGDELCDAAEGRGGACKRRLEVHKMAEANRAFNHYSW